LEAIINCPFIAEQISISFRLAVVSVFFKVHVQDVLRVFAKESGTITAHYSNSFFFWQYLIRVSQFFDFRGKTIFRANEVTTVFSFKLISLDFEVDHTKKRSDNQNQCDQPVEASAYISSLG